MKEKKSTAKRSSPPIAWGPGSFSTFVHLNPFVELYPVAYTNDPNVISRHERMISIHEAMEVDFTGLVCASGHRDRIYTGVGGLVDYMRGTTRSPQGRFIVTLHSLTPDGQSSGIVPSITPGSGLMASRAAVQYVVTEFGWTNLHGKSLRDRTIALLEISHPKFRQELLSRAQMEGLLAQGEPITFSTRAFTPRKWRRKSLVGIRRYCCGRPNPPISGPSRNFFTG